MKFPLFKQVALARDVPEEGLKKGDVATVVEHHPVSSGEDGYSPEVFNALGETIVIGDVPIFVVLRQDEVRDGDSSA